jgi:hypothetical protein
VVAIVDEPFDVIDQKRSAAKPVPVVGKISIKHVKGNFDMFPYRTELRP